MEATGADREVARPLVSTDPPVRRFADVVRAVVKTMELAGFGGNDLIAWTLARAGWKLSARTVGRIRRERWPVPRLPEVASRVPRAVRARRPNHVWTKEPSSPEITRFVSRAAKKRGHPAHFVSDRGTCFTGGVFRRKLRRLGVKQRFGAIGKKGSIALIERFWRTLKDTLGLRLLRPSVAEDLLEKIELGLVHYAYLRPHQGLGDATPAEIYFGRTPSHLFAIPPPRGRPGESPRDSPFRIEYLDAERLLPGAGSKNSLKDGHESSAKGAGVGRRVRARTHRSGRGAGLCPPTATAIPIASLQSSRKSARQERGPHDALSHYTGSALGRLHEPRSQVSEPGFNPFSAWKSLPLLHLRWQFKRDSKVSPPLFCSTATGA
jgi:hypothetical protein